MEMETDLTSKLSLREHIKNIRKVLRAVRDLDKTFFLYTGLKALLDAMGNAGQPWAVSGPAQAAGIAALKEAGYVQSVRALIAGERPWLAGELARLGFRVVPGAANYLLFFSPKPLLEPLRRRGILLRDCGNYAGLCDGWYRTAVRGHADNQRLIAALEEALKEGTI